MKKLFISFYLFLLLLVRMFGSVNLSEEEARLLINKENGYPKHIATDFTDIRYNTPLYMEIKRLERKRYLRRKFEESENEEIIEEVNGTENFLIITDKGKKLIEYIKYHPKPLDNYTFAPFTHEQKIKRIIEISVDSDNNTATVEYEVGYFPTEYFFNLRRIDKDRVDKETRNYEVYKKRMRLEKSDQGWQVIKDFPI